MTCRVSGQKQSEGAHGRWHGWPHLCSNWTKKSKGVYCGETYLIVVTADVSKEPKGWLNASAL